jgi:2-polyprenyl-6-methoxyphenol hydroxylase-like FAD-dependent oxidoreductase
MNQQHCVVSGGGIGGLACALLLGRAGHRVTLLEQAAVFAEIGAGIQLGPNAMKLLTAWGLRDAVLARASLPQAVAVHDTTTGRSISRILLGVAVQQRYGDVYASIHRADLHAVLLRAVQALPEVTLCNDETVQSFLQTPQGVTVRTAARSLQAHALIGADGVWSTVRRAVLHDGAPRDTGHVAYRALLPRAAVPAALQRDEVGVWWGRDLHVVHYPVRGGDAFNLVVLSSRGQASVDTLTQRASWDLQANANAVHLLFQKACPALMHWINAADAWQAWHLFDRAPTAGWSRGCVTLLGDAAHPMLPYLAQGASMAMEDAQVLVQCIAQAHDVHQAFKDYEAQRFTRTARVVKTAKRNGQIFHMGTPWSRARNAVLALQGTEVLGSPWLYGYETSAM